MSDDLSQLLARLQSMTPEERERLLALTTGDAVAGDKVGGDKVAGDKVIEPQGSVNLSDDGRINGVAVGVNLGRIVYGRDVEEDERRRLVWYLDGLANKLYRLPLRGLGKRLKQGASIAMPKVYMLLATEGRESFKRGTPDVLKKYIEPASTQIDVESRSLAPWARVHVKQRYHSDWALPHVAVFIADVHGDGQSHDSEIFMSRQRLVIHSVREHHYLVLLGDPGSGKSTFMRHLAWALAQQGLNEGHPTFKLVGWDSRRRHLPILLSLRALAGRLARERASDATLYATLRDEIQSYNISDVDDLLREALHRGAALLLFDGLDEVPIDAVPNITADRVTTLQAIRLFVEQYPRASVVLTCRTRAFDERLRDGLGWNVETLAPFTLGQIRHFIPAWYNELAATGQIDQVQADRTSAKLFDAITDPQRARLRTMAANPLLLTLMALVLYNQGELPRDRPQLYEQVLDLLLGQWDQSREGQSLAVYLDVPDLTSDRLRPLLDQLSYTAHAGASSDDGRGRIPRGSVRDLLITFFEREHPRRAWELAQRCLDYIEQRSGLLMPDDSDTYVFAHLTLQEHCAGRYLLLDRDAATQVLSHRADDRWHEPIFLGLGVVQQANPWLIESVLRKLIDREEDEHPKPIARWQRDLILAAEIGVDRDWNHLRDLRVDVGPLQRDLRRGLSELLEDKSQPLHAAERVRAGFLLGDLGDPRVPVTLDDWRRELARAQAGDATWYFCRVDAGTYTIGSADDDPDAGDEEKPQHTVTFEAPFWIARYPITNAQWLAWVEQAGKRPSYLAHDANLNRPNRPAMGMHWDICNDFCTWLSKQLGVTMRVPTEQEWEAAARGGDSRRYPWGDDWLDDRAATLEDQETRGARYTVPVGCYPAGAAPCGALDMAGNVWEWTASDWRSYPEANRPFAEEGQSVLRGGRYDDSRNCVRCGARLRALPGPGPVRDYCTRVVLVL